MASLLNFLIGIVPLLAILLWQNIDQYRTLIYGNERTKIPILMAGITHYSHLEKILPFAKALTDLGYPVTFTTGEDFRQMVTETGAKFEPIDGPANALTPEEWGTLASLEGSEKDIYVPVQAFIERMPGQQRTLQRLIAQLQSQYGQVVYLHDQAVFGHIPVALGKEGISANVSISFGLTAIPFTSNDTYPFPALQPPDTSPDSVRIHQQAAKEVDKTDPVAHQLDKAFADKLFEMGAKPPYPQFYDGMGSLADIHLQLGIPEFEYFRSDLPTDVRHLGIPDKVGGERNLPSWWSEMLQAKKLGKRIVVVSQGSAVPDLSHLVIPTLKVLKDRDDLFVIATTVLMEPEAVEGLEVPPNARVVKFVPFDLLLPEASLIIAAGGYGTIIQAISAGVPTILAGSFADKGHLGVLGEYTNIAINLKTENPGGDKIREAVDKILGSKGETGNQKYLEAVTKMKEISKGYDPVKIMDATILEAMQHSKKKEAGL